MAIAAIKPGTPIREFGNIIEKHAKSRGLAVVKTWGGHGINSEFHPPPWIPHYAKSKAVGTCKPGMTFTIEPILTLGKDREMDWPDDWTNVTMDGQRAAQFGGSRAPRNRCKASNTNFNDYRTYYACNRNRCRGSDSEVSRFSGWTYPLTRPGNRKLKRGIQCGRSTMIILPDIW